MTTLFYAPGACSLAPHIALEWIGAPYEAHRVTYGSPELVAVNPSGAVPALKEEDGWILTQAGAILEYLAARHPEAKLAGGEGLRAAAEAHRWSSFFTGDLHPSFYPVFMPDRYTTDRSEAGLAATRAAGLDLVRKRFKILDAHLQGREWILEGRSVMDAYAFPMIRWGRAKLPEGMGAYPNVMALHDRLAADEKVKTVLAREAAK
ncbi:glutathione S-transferase N-terminal domain-containing protein [Neomegalonema sp.]|uniref:glutathione S-transferase family protein n=1 Tax=Neomegalonema sp. TaxID=2039713 RepID=UPI002612EC37|nr:glutathione S-transferase N-terminal domain-containing protein [Neomegalonema sp.]MDD2867319.1 glutathione S-transferase N-terminal domain-containing protein [Neomegalonema sp.]